jgi:hypothetical protein
MKITSNTALNFYNTERKNINRANNLLQINNESEMFNITPKLKTEDILIPTEVETYLNVTQNIFYINKIPYSLQTIGKMLTIL